MDEQKLRRDIIDACLRMNACGINQGTSGNIAVRWRKGLLITPSGLPYERMTPQDIVFLHMDGRHEGRNRPSSEWRIHRDILAARQDVKAIVHAHPIYCTILSIRRQEIPAIHYMIAAAGGPTIRCAPYATFGTEELSHHTLAALEDRKACLLANHGMVATGTNLDKAMWLAIEVETLARQYVGVLQIGEPTILPEEEIARVLEKFRSYGPQERNG